MPTLIEEVYASPGGRTLSFDAFLPDSDGPHPVVVCIHGGGWISGDKEDMSDVARLFSQAGFAGICPEYRLAPLNPYPAAVEDIQALLSFITQDGDKLGLDASRVATFGNSAGGHLAAMAGLAEGSPVTEVISVCPITDLTSPHQQHFAIAWGFLEQFMSVPYEGNEAIYRGASPLHLAHVTAPPFLLIHGVEDDIVPVAQSDALAQKLRSLGVPVDYHRMPGEAHSFTYEAWMEIMRLSTAFLKERWID